MEDQSDTGTDTVGEITVLCAERVSQMTKTYNDIEAVTRLLEEKERDLELAARIGQTLLSKNKELSARSESLEEQLSVATDKVNQLHHDISVKEDLLRFYNDNLDHEHSEDAASSEKSGPVVSMDFLEKKVRTLEDENISLRYESSKLKSDTDTLEEREKRLVEDCIQQLADVNVQVEALAEELHQKAEENAYHKEEITTLLAQVADLQQKIRKLTHENVKIHEELILSSESQRKLTKELGSMQDRNDELFEMLKEAQDELRVLRGKNKVCSTGQHHHSAYNLPTDSLASELETSMQQEISPPKRRSQKWKVFETAKAARKATDKAARRDRSFGTPLSLKEIDSRGTSAYPSDVESLPSDGYSTDLDSLSNPELGQPGIPGSNDLESALKRLALRRANEHEKDLQDEEDERRRKIQAAISAGTSPYSGRSPNPWGLRSPAGSLTSSNWSSGGPNNQHYKLSEKLQIVKPMEGSLTLRHWQHLATPNLGGIFEERDGVQIKGEKKIDPIDGIYSLSDFEEDDDMQYANAQGGQDTGFAYTYTDSTASSPVSHLGFLGTSSPVAGHMNTEEQVSGASLDLRHNHMTQQPAHSGNNSHSTPRPLGLASLLQGRETTDVGRAIMRVSALKMATTPKETPSSPATNYNSDINMMALSARSLESSASSSSTHRSIPGSRSFEQAMREYEDKKKASESKSTKKPELFAPGMTGQGFLQQLKSKGYSLYGLWGGGAKDSKSEGTESSADADTDAGNGAKATNESAFSTGAGVGVLGALTNLRRNGMF